MNQRGFATLEVILMVMVIGILASIAVPRFNNVTTAANTAKVQSDLATIDTAIAIYIMEKGSASVPTTVSGLEDYLQDAKNLTPPKGDVYIDGEAKPIPASSYVIQQVDNDYRATLGGKTAGAFSTQKNTN